MTPQELERFGIAITGSRNWISPLAKLMGVSGPEVVRSWCTGKAKITVPKQRKLFLLAGLPEPRPVPICEPTRKRLERISALRDQGRTYKSIGQELGITKQAVQAMERRYR